MLLFVSEPTPAVPRHSGSRTACTLCKDPSNPSSLYQGLRGLLKVGSPGIEELEDATWFASKNAGMVAYKYSLGCAQRGLSFVGLAS